MRNQWSRGTEAAILAAVAALLVAISVGQHRRLAAIQLEQDKVEYAARVRATQVIIEDEMLRSAFATAADEQVRQLARKYLETEPE